MTAQVIDYRFTSTTSATDNQERTTTEPNDATQRPSEPVRGTYIRWGAKDCPNDAKCIYTGYAGGQRYEYKGSGDTICLPNNPQHYNTTSPGRDGMGQIYGTQYRANEIPVFKDVYAGLVPCAVCSVTRSVIMIPGRITCTAGWKHEYHGYLMAGYNAGGHESASEYLCVDNKPQTVDAKRDRTAYATLLYMVEPDCNALPCGPYDRTKELSCVVCSA